ncbi:DUF6571 family protein, partial [Actinomyces ruminis]
RERWEALTDGGWDSNTLEELTAAMAAVSTLRASQDEEISAAATWVTARSIEFAVDQVPSRYYTSTMKRNLAVLLGNIPDEVAALAGGESLDRPDLYGLSGLVTDAQFETVLYRVIDDEHAAEALTSAMLQYHHDRIDSQMPTAADPEATVLGQYQSAAQTMGYLDGIAELHTNNNTAPDPITPETAHEYITWQRHVNDPTMDSIDHEMVNTKTGYDQGQAAKVTD